MPLTIATHSLSETRLFGGNASRRSPRTRGRSCCEVRLRCAVKPGDVSVAVFRSSAFGVPSFETSGVEPLRGAITAIFGEFQLIAKLPLRRRQQTDGATCAFAGTVDYAIRAAGRQPAELHGIAGQHGPQVDVSGSAVIHEYSLKACVPILIERQARPDGLPREAELASGIGIIAPFPPRTGASTP